ncbi:MAG: Bifunctional PGK [candidate division WS2 bacterium]|nr:Bifunctional PGK [Candidatus Lithacetigena glycinireducens]
MENNLLFIANWKMNNAYADLVSYFNIFLPLYNQTKPVNDVVFLPPFTLLYLIKEILKATNLKWGAQNFYYESKGAFTGEISALMIKDTGSTYVLIGHSERRKYFKENSQIIANKLHKAFSENIIPIVCVGETLEERKSGKTFSVLANQMKPILKTYQNFINKEIVVAYEPVWAIGTGVNATIEEIKESHSFILSLFLKQSWVNDSNIKIVYGGSIDSKITPAIVSLDVVNGCLVGGASLKPEEFIKIVNTIRS